MSLPKVTVSLSSLGLIYFMVMLAGFFAPYDPTVQDRDVPNQPPTRIHWTSLADRPALRPYVREVGGATQDRGNEDEHGIPYYVHFLPRGSQYQIIGKLTWDRHLFGVESPARVFLMGTDNYGRDVFSRLLYGGQISLFAGLFATALSLGIGLILGTLAGFYGGWPDALIMRGVELFMALPWLYLLLALRAFLPLHTGPRQTFILLIGVIGLVGWARPARLIRGVVLSAKERTHLLAARSFGASNVYLLRRHVLPETRSVVLTQAALLMPQFVLAEVTLSFLGLGVGEPVPSWGTMLGALQQYHVLVSDWWMFFPGMFIVIVFLGYGLLSDALQEDSSRMGVGWNGL
jgi:peptide/nickel transport system permease protein